MATVSEVKKQLQKAGDTKKAETYQWFFKTGKGEYGEGDVFLGIQMGEQRKIAKQNKDLSLKQVEQLLRSKIHEHRMVALLILIEQYKRADEQGKKEIYTLYMKSYDYINNWDLVDVTAPHIVGDYLSDKKDRKKLYTFARSNHLWKKRIAMISCFTFIRDKDFSDALKIAKILLQDKHDLIHKAVGWMLREVGNRDKKAEIAFLDAHYKKMPRTMLRYAIEKFPEKQRQHYLKT